MVKIIITVMAIKIVLPVMLITGCASTTELTSAAQYRAITAKERLLSETFPCCSEFSQLEYHFLSTNRTTAVFGGTPASVYEFDTGKSYIFGIELPALAAEEIILLRSEMLNGGRGSIPTVFAPHVLYLNEHYKPVDKSTVIALCFHRGWTSADVGYFGKLKSIPSTAKYAVIFTDLSSIGETIPYSSSAVAAGGGIITDINVEYDFPKSPEGSADIWIAEHDSRNKSILGNCW